MPKQAIVAALEEVFGEYVLNLSKDDLKIAALRGKIALENVQLDGDMIGGHILGVFGLTGFGVLSCSAKSVKISVPWKNLEKEATRFEIRGIHLVCVPLIPSTANNMYGAGTRQDPLCTLRTRAKRLALSRFERNFWNGLIPGEGPPMKRISRAVKEVEKELKRSQKRRLVRDKKMEGDSDFEDAMDRLVGDLTETSSIHKDESEELMGQFDQLPELPRDWKVKLREKVLRNMEASIFDTHIRCEVPAKSDGGDGAFACGFTLESFTVRTANEKWEAGSHDKKNEIDGSPMSSAQGHLGPNEYVVKNNKIGYFKNLSLYCDDRPPILLAETEVLQGNSKKLSTDKLISRIAVAMEVMSAQQDPGPGIRNSLSTTRHAKTTSENVDVIPHQYICKGFASEIRSRSSDRTQPGPISCSADVLPCEFNFDILPEQYAHYRKLKADMKAQQRFDTMFRQRPTKNAVEDPKAWWKYAFACVISRPNFRPWGDIKIICRSRSRYIELVSKKSTKPTGNQGFHSGLSETESEELLALEDLLPIEALLAFHLLALRKAYQQQCKRAKQDISNENKDTSSRTLSPFRLLRPRNSKRDSKKGTHVFDSSERSSDNRDISQRSFKGLSLFDAMTLRLGKKMWFVDWRLHDAIVNVAIHNTAHREHSLRLVFRTSGRSRVFGLGKRDFFFDINQCDLSHGEDTVLFTRLANGGVDEKEDEDLDDFFASDRALSTLAYCEKTQGAGLDLETSADFLELPPPGTLCRIAAGRTKDLLKVSVSAHPLTLVWTKSLFDCISEFVGRSDPGLGVELAEHIRNATPLARKAQLAFLSPASSALHINVAAPKVWIPVLSSDSEGALFVDAGNMKFSSRKGEGKVESDWDIDARDLQVNYVRGYSISRLHHEPLYIDTAYKAETSVIKPFSVNAQSKILDEASSLDDQMTKKGVAFMGQVRYQEAVVSPICLSLVDAEVLARSFGKIYTRGIGQLRSREAEEADKASYSRCLRREEERKLELLIRSGIPRRLNMKVDKVEIAIEGHSKRRSPFATDDKSNISMDDSTFFDISPPVRIYLVEIFRVVVDRSIIEEIETTKLSVFDASIIRLREGSFYTPLRVGRELVESENCILECSRRQRSINASVDDGMDSQPPVLTVSFLRDEVAHLDEVELDVNFITMRVTPTTLKDCTKAFKKIVELVQLATKEMERKVHEAGRKARRDRFARDFQSRPGSPGLMERPLSPSISISEDNSMILTSSERLSPRFASDSSILFKITLNKSTILAGRPTMLNTERSRLVAERRTQYAVIQILSNALIMFQSIENPDGTGNKTLHVSLENVSSLVNTEFERVGPSQVPPMIGPFGTEFRVVYATENLGCVVAQDVSLDCETVKSRLTPNDFSIMINILRRMVDRLRVFGSQVPLTDETHAPKPLSPIQTLVRYRKKGTGIATTIRTEIHAFSFVLLRAFKSHAGAPEFLDFNIEQIKMKLEGCMSALSGDCSALLSINSFNSEVEDWEYAVEPFPFVISVEQMPNELFLGASTSDTIHLNLTGTMLRDLAEMKFDILKDHSSAYRNDNIISPSALSTVGLRRATEARTIKMKNTTGLDLHVLHNLISADQNLGFAAGNAEIVLGHLVEGNTHNQHTMSIRLASTSAAIVGERQPLTDLPITSLSRSNAALYILHPSSSAGLEKRTECDIAYYNAEPVVESCMRNERLRSSVNDVFGLPKGRDLLSSEVWSLDQENNEGAVLKGAFAKEAGGRGRSGEKRGSKSIGNWLKPFLKNDPPEWSDMTCTLRLARDRIMLPDNNWRWVDEWNVDLSGKLGVHTDADGWEYQADFETFTRCKRAYQRGDACRRQRWTRTRILNPPKMNDPLRPLKLVWETAQDENGNYSISVRSNVRIFNMTGAPLSAFLFCPSWDKDEIAGTVQPGEHVDVPVLLASAIYMRIAKLPNTKQPAIEDCLFTERFMILPESQSSSNFIRTSMDLKDVSGTVLHHLIEVKSEGGIVEITIEPVFRVMNLLPCQLECQVGHSKSTQGICSISQTETMSISSGKDGCCTAVDPWRKPHISLRVPGYRWSTWHRIVNRTAKSDTWRPSTKEEDSHFTLQGDSDFADELTTVIIFERIGRIGDPLTLLLSVECGHCPILRVYSQYWIIDKSGFGCRFSEGFLDILASIPDNQTSRRSHLLPEERKDPEIRKDMLISGHQWSVGMSGMTLYFSKREKLTMCIEVRNGSRKTDCERIRTKWIAPLDISNVLPKTVFAVEEMHGQRLFELAFNVTVCPGVFCRTKIITLLPRYQIVNLLHRELVIGQDGSLDRPTVMASQSTTSFYWENGSLPFKVRIGAPSDDEKRLEKYDNCWSNGVLQIDRVGITSMRLPASNNLAAAPMVIQAEVRLAAKNQPSAVVVVVWSANEKSNPLYILRNRTMHTILCRQPINDQSRKRADDKETHQTLSESCSPRTSIESDFHCGAEIGPAIRSFLGLEKVEEFVWIIESGRETCFGFDNPEKPHVLEWSCVTSKKTSFDNAINRSYVEIDEMGSSSVLKLPGRQQILCMIKAEHSTKVVEFVEDNNFHLSTLSHSPVSENILGTLAVVGVEFDGKAVRMKTDVTEDEEEVAFGVKLRIPSLLVSVLDNVDPHVHGREILVARAEKVFLGFSQTREGYHELELTVATFQIDNHVRKSIHPILVFCPQVDPKEPLLHMSAVRRIQDLRNTFVFRYAAIRLLEIEIYLDRRTAETIARFIEPLTTQTENRVEETDWVAKLTKSTEASFAKPDHRVPKDIETMIHSANSGRIYFERLHLHPVRIGLTFTQEWMDWTPGSEGMMLFQFIRGMTSIANAPLVFTSFVVGHVFEAPQTLMRVIATHYSSQLTKQIFGILGSLAILGAPADFISNVGSGVRDFFYEPIQGAVHGPRQFIEGLEAGTQSLARGVFVGVVRGVSNVTEVVNTNLAGLTADDDFMDERRAYQRMMTDGMSRGSSHRTFSDSLYLAGASVARSVRSGALGIVEQPGVYASKHGPVGFVKGIGKALVGAVVKPVVGVGDAAVLVMNHMSDATSKKRVVPKIPIRIRRALPCRSIEKINCVRLEPFDERAAKAQRIVTGGETLDDVYIGHIDIPNHLIIASEQCLWAIDRRSREPWCVDWEEISHFGQLEGGIRIVIFSQTGLRTYMFHTESNAQSILLQNLLSMQSRKMANSSELDDEVLSADPDSLSRRSITGVKARQVDHVFGSFNNYKRKLDNNVKDEVDLVEQCRARVRVMGSESSTYFRSLDEEAWSLVSNWGQVFSGLSSRRCIVASIINGTGGPLQIKTTKLLEGGSPCFSIPTKEFDKEQGILYSGGCIIFFAWGVGPNLLQAGNVFMYIETNAFVCELADHKNRATYAKAMPGYQVGFLEKSYDDSVWWAKYWILVRSAK